MSSPWSSAPVCAQAKAQELVCLSIEKLLWALIGPSEGLVLWRQSKPGSLGGKQGHI